MPELAEVKLTADYVTQAARSRKFYSIKKNPQHKGEEVLVPNAKENPFTLRAESRGKEMRLVINDESLLSMTMGMSGYFRLTKTGEEVKHSHLMFLSTDGFTLSFVDVRRFGKWKWVTDWASNRGPDPVYEHQDFVSNIHNNLDKTAFKKPVCEVLMNQKFFNGIGNYLRAEVLYRIPELNPFTDAKTAIQNYPEILDLCKEIPLKAYLLGGGQLRDWENPFSADDKDLKKFIRCYGNPQMSKVKDKSGRTFWYDPKWDKLDMETEWDHYSGLPNPNAYK